MVSMIHALMQEAQCSYTENFVNILIMNNHNELLFFI